MYWVVTVYQNTLCSKHYTWKNKMHTCGLRGTILLGMQTEDEFTSNWDKKKNGFRVLTTCILSLKKNTRKASKAMLSVLILKRRIFHETSTLRDSEKCTDILNSTFIAGIVMDSIWLPLEVDFKENQRIMVMAIKKICRRPKQYGLSVWLFDD